MMEATVSNSTQFPLFDPIQIPLTRGYITIVDPIDADLAQYKWCRKPWKGGAYAHRNINGHMIMMHRLILERILGRSLTPQELCDHKDGNSLNNQRCNLRLATKQQNVMNSVKNSRNKSGYKGVCWHKSHQRWHAQIELDHHKIHIGYYRTSEEAYQAYCEAAIRYFGEFARIGK